MSQQEINYSADHALVTEVVNAWHEMAEEDREANDGPISTLPDAVYDTYDTLVCVTRADLVKRGEDTSAIDAKLSALEDWFTQYNDPEMHVYTREEKDHWARYSNEVG